MQRLGFCGCGNPTGDNIPTYYRVTLYNGATDKMCPRCVRDFVNCTKPHRLRNPVVKVEKFSDNTWIEVDLSEFREEE